jgi:hypothetical protein
MAETNFYSYMYSQAGSVAFDELAEVVELSNPESVQRAFESYLDDYAPPLDIKEALLEEKFYMSEGEGPDGGDKYLRYDMSIPGVAEPIDKDGLQNYFEDFIEKIGAQNNSESAYTVEVELLDNERGGVDIDIFIALSGKQIREKNGN